MMGTEGMRHVRRLSGRVRLALFVSGVVDAAGLLALAGGTVLLLLRLFGTAVLPQAWWIALGLLPIAWGCVALLRHAPDTAACALWLDRKLRLGGLMLSGLEADASAWQEVLRRRFAATPARVPSLRIPRLGRRLALPVAF